MPWYAALGLALVGHPLPDDIPTAPNHGPNTPVEPPRSGASKPREVHAEPGRDHAPVEPPRSGVSKPRAVRAEPGRDHAPVEQPGRDHAPVEPPRSGVSKPRAVHAEPGHTPSTLKPASAPPGPPSPERIDAALTAAGYDRHRLAHLVTERQSAELPWPFPVAAEQRPGIGAAQFVSVLREVTDYLDVHSWQHAAPAPDRPLTADERRLLADVPPHWS
ncbi:MAG: hypothetical protein GXX86_10805 [Propionibacterium sp.]|nr:hypothetical protein [Propionibacterium sp.]